MEDVIYNKMFIPKPSNQNHARKILIADYGATQYMVNLEENMTNLKDAKTRVTIGYRRKLTGKKHGDWHGYQRYDGKLYRVILSNMAVEGLISL